MRPNLTRSLRRAASVAVGAVAVAVSLAAPVGVTEAAVVAPNGAWASISVVCDPLSNAIKVAYPYSNHAAGGPLVALSVYNMANVRRVATATLNDFGAYFYLADGTYNIRVDYYFWYGGRVHSRWEWQPTYRIQSFGYTSAYTSNLCLL